MAWFEYLLLKELLQPGAARRTLIVVPTIFALIVVVWFLAGEDAGQTAIRLVLFAGVAAVLCLPLLGIFWGFMWLVAVFGPEDKK